MTTAPHDALFKATFSRPERAAELLRSVLDPGLAARIDWQSLETRQGSFVDKHLRSRHTDLLFTTKTDAGDICVYFLCEHKSKPEWWIGLSLLRYMVHIWFDHLRRHKQARKLPPILPVVIHHGEKAWAVDPEFSALIACPVDIPGLLSFTPKFRFAFADLATVDAETLRTGAGSATIRATLLALKESRSARSLQDLLMSWATVLNELEREADGIHAIELISQYLVAVRQAEEFEHIDYHALGLGKTSEALMTREAYLLKKGREEGREEGIEKGIEKGQRTLLLNQLRGKFSHVPPAVAARVEAADAAALARWSMRLLAASNLDDVFAGTPA